jgi:hypothetical protein
MFVSGFVTEAYIAQIGAAWVRLAEHIFCETRIRPEIVEFRLKISCKAVRAD